MIEFYLCVDVGCLFADNGSASVPRPAPQPRSNNTATVSLLDEPVPSLLLSDVPSDPTPSLLPLAQDGGHLGPDGGVGGQEGTAPIPVKPERKKKKGGPPPVPAPYSGPKKAGGEVSEL